MVAAVAIIILAGAIFVLIRTAREVKAIKANYLASAEFDFGGVKGMAYLVADKVANQKVYYPCLTVQIPIEIGNFDIVAVRQYGRLPIYKVYRYTLPDYTFSKNAGTAWDAMLTISHLNLSGANNDQIAVHQFENCYETQDSLVALTKTGFGTINFNPLKSSETSEVVQLNGAKFSSAGQDKMNTLLLTGDPKQPYAIVHWQFDSKTNRFNETGKDLYSKLP